MQKKTFITESRRKTPWTGKEDNTSLQSFIDKTVLSAFEYRHARLSDTEEVELFNSYAHEACPACSSPRGIRYGKTRNGKKRYRCSKCGTTFTITTGMIFQDHKIPLSEWIDFCLGIFRYQSFNSISKSNRNAYTTTKYWLSKLFLILEDY